MDLIFFNVHQYVGVLAYVDFGTPNVTEVVTFAKEAVGKVKGKKSKARSGHQASAVGSGITFPVPVGQSANVGGWQVKVASVSPYTPGSTTLFTAPPAGYTFEVYTLQVTRAATKPAAPSLSLIVSLVGPSHVERGVDSSPMCYGGSPDNNDVLKGGTVTFGGCISVLSSDAAQLVVVVKTFTTFSGKSTWFAAPTG